MKLDEFIDLIIQEYKKDDWLYKQIIEANKINTHIGKEEADKVLSKLNNNK